MSSLITNERSVCLVSGGVDSVVLLSKIVQVTNKVEVVHINHQTRGDSNLLDEQLVKDYCEQYNIKCHIFKYNHEVGNFQSAARQFRYEMAANQIADEQTRIIYTAHHFDDQLENVFMNQDKLSPTLMKPKGELTIGNKQYQIIRPLLNVSKAEIREYAQANNLKFNEDVSNFESKYKRNYYRNQVLANMDYNQKLEILQQQQQKEQLFHDLNVEKEITIDAFKQMSELQQKMYIYKLIRTVDPIGNISNRIINDFLSKISISSTKEFELKNGYILVKGYETIYIYNKNKKLEQVKVTQKGNNIFNDIEFVSEISGLKVTTPQKNDIILIKNGTKKLTRVFIDAKVDRNKRSGYPIVRNEKNEIIWIPKIWRKNAID